jgi:hypothetical protein
MRRIAQAKRGTTFASTVTLTISSVETKAALRKVPSKLKKNFFNHGFV